MKPKAGRRMWAWAGLLLFVIHWGLVAAQYSPVDFNDTSSGDRALLYAVRRGIDNWNDFTASNGIQGWNDTTPICQWTGISCSALGRVTGIKLGCYGCSKQAIGGLSSALANFTTLQELDFSNQFLAGSLPDTWGSAGVIPQLQVLNLASNQLTGTLPESWGSPGAFPALRTLQLSNNQLTGTLPSSWGSSGSFSSIQVLDLRHNALTGTLPEEWGDEAWGSLTELYLGSNLNLTGSIPEGWVVDSGFLSLEVMSLDHNQLDGELPPGFGDPPAALRTLDLSHNLFRGALPAGWSGEGTTNVTSIFLNGCQLDGTLPDSWAEAGAFGVLRVLDLSQNHIEGPLPTSWGSEVAFPALETLNLQENWLNHDLPAEWGYRASFPSLRNLLLAYNAFRLTLPSSWGANRSLSVLANLDLSANYLTGTLPESWGYSTVLPKLSSLNLTWNRFYGTIPPEWASAPALSELVFQPGNYQMCGGLPMGSKAMLCKDLGTGCSLQQSLGQSCILDPPSRAKYIPPIDTNTSMQAIVRLRSGPQPVTNETLTSSLASALLYTLTSAKSAQVTQLVPPGSSPFSYPKANGTRRLLEQLPWEGAGSARSRRRLTQAGTGAPAPGPGSLVPGIVDAVIQFTAASGSSVLKMEEQLLTIVSSQALINVLNSSQAGVTGVELVSVEPASLDELPDWWKAIKPWNPNNVTSAGISPGDAADPDGIMQREAESHERPVGVIVGVSVAACVILGMIATAVVVLRRKRLKRRRSEALERSSHQTHFGGLRKGSPGTEDSQVVYGIPQQPSLQGSQLGGLSGDAFAVAALSRRRSTGLEPEPEAILQDAEGSTMLTLPSMPWSDWEIQPEEIEICTRPDGRLWELGTGSFGMVYKAMRASSEPVAVKLLHEREGGPEFGNEIALLKACRHSNIVQFQGACLQGGRVMLVTEFMEGGDLFRALSNPHAREMLRWCSCGRKVAMDIARGLLFLHTHRVVHLDLKSHNILLSREGTAKITDVGLSKIVQGSYLSKLDNVVGTFVYAAPELLLGVRCTERVDIYSFGVLLWEIATGERPQRGQMREVRVPEELPEDVEALRQQCMDLKPEERPSAKEVYDRLAASRQS